MRVQDTIVFFGSARSLSPSGIRRLERDLKAKGAGADEWKRFELQKKISGYYRDASRLACKLTKWSKELNRTKTSNRRFLICSGGGPGMMEAANRGASLAKGLSVGLNISLPFEQEPNPYITPSLSFNFHYFFMRKYWLMNLAKALVVFPGGFGTMDELFELLTLIQTHKLSKPLPIVIYGTEYWKKLIHFETFVEWGMIHENDLNYLHFSDDVDEAYEYLVDRLSEIHLSADKDK